MQHERDTRRETYEDARQKEARERNFLSDDMIGEWEFLEIVVEGSDASEDLLKAKAALTASRLKGFRLRFWKGSDTSYYYRIENLITKSHGKYVTRRVYWGDEPQTARLYLYPISGSHISDLIFNFTKRSKIMEVSVKEASLDLTLHLGMVLSPDGWLRRGNIRCSFQRIE
ncbi:hypothetical protein F4Y93_09740 [Candidatus Poribacteria bacterium]|nr:hypothetical protein [Candidatus Poribacteria bacterium]